MHSEIIKHAQSLIAERINPFPTNGLYVCDKLEFVVYFLSVSCYNIKNIFLERVYAG